MGRNQLRVGFAAAVAAAALLALGLALARPLGPGSLDPRPRPAAGYEAAVGRVVALSGGDGEGPLSPRCGTLFLSHGHATSRVVVLFHGMTNCPAQFDSLARILFDGGANVLVPRLPHHGLADRMTGALGKSDAAELRDFTDRVIDAADGLGATIVVAGLSLGGTLAAWAAQNRVEVDRAVLVAPLLAPPGLAPPVARAGTRLAAALPNAQVWWDRKKKQDLAGPAHVYPRFATRAAAASFLLGAAVLDQAAGAPPACGSAAFVLVEHDPAVDNRTCLALARTWSEGGGRPVEVFTFPDSLRLNHDVVDPRQVGARTDLTYPVLLRLLAP